VCQAPLGQLVLASAVVWDSTQPTRRSGGGGDVTRRQRCVMSPNYCGHLLSLRRQSCASRTAGSNNAVSFVDFESVSLLPGRTYVACIVKSLGRPPCKICCSVLLVMCLCHSARRRCCDCRQGSCACYPSFRDESVS